MSVPECRLVHTSAVLVEARRERWIPKLGLQALVSCLIVCWE